MVAVRHLVQLCHVEEPREFIKVKHRVVLAMFAKERHILAEIHILEVIGDKTAVTALNALAKFIQNLVRSYFFHFTTPRFELAINSVSRSTSLQSLISSLIRSSACVVLSRAESNR